MGGGDLNLKKSWHPSTLRNIERVWKAEQKHEAEQQKIDQLQKELAAERAREEIHAYAEDQGVVRKKEERLDWLYQGPAALVNRDDYLLGRKIDKTLELLQSQENGDSKEETFVGSVFRPNASSSNVTVDLATKIREDPLFAIMKKEKDQRKTLLSNPVRMKQLKTMLEESLGKKKSVEKKKGHKRNPSPSSSSSSSDSESDDEARSSKRRKPTHRNNNHSKEHHRTSHRDVGKSHKTYKSDNSKRSSKEKDRKPRHRDDRNYEERRYSSKYQDDRRFAESKSYERTRDSYSDRRSKYDAKPKPEPKKKMDEAERARLLAEMVDNAKWRENQRQKNVKRYIKEGEMEDKIGDGDASKFIRPMLSKATEHGSVENRIKQKIFTNQKSHGHMDSSFIRRK